MSDAVPFSKQTCDNCPLPAKVRALGEEVADVKLDVMRAITELRAETSLLKEAFGGHIKSLTNVILRFNSKLEHARASMDELTTGLSELGVGVKINMKRRASRRGGNRVNR